MDQSKVSIIKTLLPPTTVKGIRSFLGHTDVYRRFIKYFSKISRPLCRLLEKDAKFDFHELYKAAFDEIKSRLVTATIMVTPDWNKEFEVYVMPVIFQWELYWDKEQRRYSRPYTMVAKHLMKLKKTTLQLKKKCWQWWLLVKNSGLTYWDPML